MGATYLKLSGINGNVTAEGYQNWIELHHMEFGVSRPIQQHIGNTHGREAGYPNVSQLSFTKTLDKASNPLLDNALTGTSLGTAIIHHCTTGAQLKPYAKYELSNVIVSRFQEISGEHGLPIEHVTLNFTALQKTYIAQGPNGQAASPHIIGYNLATGKAT